MEIKNYVAIILITCVPVSLGAAGTEECPEYWISRKENDGTTFCYRLNAIYKSFWDAEEMCQEKNAHLASIHSEEEYDFLYENFQKGVGFDPYIGLTRKDDGSTWAWTDQTPYDFQHWAYHRKS